MDFNFPMQKTIKFQDKTLEMSIPKDVFEQHSLFQRIKFALEGNKDNALDAMTSKFLDYCVFKDKDAKIIAKEDMTLPELIFISENYSQYCINFFSQALKMAI